MLSVFSEFFSKGLAADFLINGSSLTIGYGFFEWLHF
jgi:hypothetical protein